MNQRIKLLVNKIDRIKDMYEIGPVQQAAIEDFADLIVWECVDVALASSHRADDMAAIVSNHIKKHFGVDGTSIKVGGRVKVLAGFNVGARGTVNYIEPTGILWVRRDGASSDVFYHPHEVTEIEA